MSLRLLFAAGGTGGHIFPALAVAEQCKAIASDVEVEFVGTRGRLEENVIPKAGYRLNFLWISGLDRKLTSMATLPLKIATSLAQAHRLISRYKPNVVICAGAYVSYPIGLAASMRNIPLVLMESNAYPGLVLRRLAPRATEIHVAFRAAIDHLRNEHVVVSGNPIRSIFFEKIDKAEARRHFGLDPDRQTLFAFGGSLGARSINGALDASIDRLLKDGVQIIWQTGTSYRGAERNDAGLYRTTFLNEMHLGYAAADLVIARAGAMTITELAAVGKASILVPLPIETVRQKENAMVMQEAGAAEMILDGELAPKLYDVASQLLADPQRLQTMSDRARSLSVSDRAAERIAQRVVELGRAEDRGRRTEDRGQSRED